MQAISFFIEGQPRQQQRHRTFRRGNKNIQYDPSADEKKDFLIKALEHKPEKQIDTAFVMKLVFIFDRPKSHFRTGKFANELKTGAPIHMTNTPDIDNLIKFVLDALNKKFYTDDSQCITITASKEYKTKNQTAGTFVSIITVD
jgi:Holliday junction resolvase RusA-like endonuclease